MGSPIFGHLRKYGSWAVITGTTSGLGYEFASLLAQEGFNLVLIARRAELLAEHAKSFASTFGVEVEVVCADLNQPSSAQEIINAIQHLDIGLFISNAATGTNDYFTNIAVEDIKKLFQVNIIAPLELMHFFVKKMTDRKAGGILIVSSMAAELKIPTRSAYGASKASLSYLGKTLHWELKECGVDVTVLEPGGIDTPMVQDIEINDAMLMAPRKVAQIGLKALGKTDMVIPGLLNKLIYFSVKYIIPKKLAAKILMRV